MYVDWAGVGAEGVRGPISRQKIVNTYVSWAAGQAGGADQ